MSTDAEVISDFVTLRDMRPSDRAYVLRTWIESYSMSPIARALDHRYGPAWAPLVEQQLARSKPRIACLSVDTDTIVGFAILDPSRRLVHYVAVRERWRRKGVATMLLAGLMEDDKAWDYSSQCPHYLENAVPTGWSYRPMAGAGLEST